MIAVKSCPKCGGDTYDDAEDVADVCFQCGFRHYRGTIGTLDDVEGRRKRKGVNHKYEEAYYKQGHSPRHMFD